MGSPSGRSSRSRWASAVLFLGIAVLFLFPFLFAGCKGDHVITGLEAAVGADLAGLGTKTVPSDEVPILWAAVPLAAAVGGLGLSLLKGRFPTTLRVLVSAGGATILTGVLPYCLERTHFRCAPLPAHGLALLLFLAAVWLGPMVASQGHDSAGRVVRVWSATFGGMLVLLLVAPALWLDESQILGGLGGLVGTVAVLSWMLGLTLTVFLAVGGVRSQWIDLSAVRGAGTALDGARVRAVAWSALLIIVLAAAGLGVFVAGVAALTATDARTDANLVASLFVSVLAIGSLVIWALPVPLTSPVGPTPARRRLPKAPSGSEEREV